MRLRRPARLRHRQRMRRTSIRPRPTTRFLLLLAPLVPAAPVAAQQAQPERGIEAHAITPGITLLRSHPDGNMLVVEGASGVLLVDALSPELAERADSAVRAAGGATPRWVVNTHYHADHIGANPRLAADGAILHAQAAMPRLAKRDTTIEVLQWDLDPADPAALPAVEVGDSLRIDLGDDVARVIHVPNAHTAGDLVVRIDRANVLHTGDLVEFGAYPFIDWWAGGSYDGLLAGVDQVLSLTDDRTVIVPGHGRVLSRADVVEYRDMLAKVGSRVRAAIEAGQPIDDLVAENITSSWDAEHGGVRHGSRFVRLLHHELTQGKRQP